MTIYDHYVYFVTHKYRIYYKRVLSTCTCTKTEKSQKSQKILTIIYSSHVVYCHSRMHENSISSLHWYLHNGIKPSLDPFIGKTIDIHNYLKDPVKFRKSIQYGITQGTLLFLSMQFWCCAIANSLCFAKQETFKAIPMFLHICPTEYNVNLQYHIHVLSAVAPHIIVFHTSLSAVIVCWRAILVSFHCKLYSCL